MQNRRTLFGFLFAALALFAGLFAAVGADAERYQNQSGLSAGRFVWSPTLAREGPVTIVVSPGEGSAHVYRNGVEIGITTVKIGGGGSASGIVLVSEIEGRIENDTANRPLVWRGMELFTGAAGGLAGGDFQAVLPRELAELLMAATHRGAAVIVARERSGPQFFSAPGPFIDPLETGSLNRVARFAQPELRAQLDKFDAQAGPSRAVPQSVDAPSKAAAAPLDPAEPTAGSPGSAGVQGAATRVPVPSSLRRGTGSKAADAEMPGPETITGVRGEMTSIILSRADLSAYVMKDGRLVDRLPIAVEQPTRPFGLHAAVLVAPGTAAREARWLAFGLDDDREAAHVVAPRAEQALRRVRFMDRGRAAALAQSLRAGAVVVLMDGHGPSATDAPRFDVAVLTSEAGGASAEAPQPSPPAGPAPAQAEERTGAERAGASAASSKSARKGSASEQRAREASPRPRRKRGPLDHREAWPNSLYWPY